MRGEGTKSKGRHLEICMCSAPRCVLLLCAGRKWPCLLVGTEETLYFNKKMALNQGVELGFKQPFGVDKAMGHGTAFRTCFKGTMSVQGLSCTWRGQRWGMMGFSDNKHAAHLNMNREGKGKWGAL